MSYQDIGGSVDSVLSRTDIPPWCTLDWTGLDVDTKAQTEGDKDHKKMGGNTDENNQRQGWQQDADEEQEQEVNYRQRKAM